MTILIHGPVAFTGKMPRRLRGSLAAATALAGLIGLVDLLPAHAQAQGVKLAPLGSHAAPSEAVPVYAGADLGQDAPNPLVIPPPLTRAAAAPAPAPAAPPAPIEPQAAPMPAPAPAPVADLQPPPAAVVPQPRVAAPRPLPRPVAPAPSADDLNAQQLQPVSAPAPRPALVSRQPVITPGSAPMYPGAQVVAQAFTPRATLPAEYQYQAPGRRVVQVQAAPAAAPGSTGLPGDDGPLLTGGAAALPVASPAPATPPPGAQPYSPERAVQVAAPYNAPASITAQASNAPGFGTAGYDPVTQEIDRNIRELRAAVAPSVQVGADYLGHSGESGLSKLNTYMEPVEATFSPAGIGQLKLSVTPTQLYAGRLGGSDSNFQRFGTMAVGIQAPFVSKTAPYTYTPPTYFGPKPKDQSADGVGLDLRYTFGYGSVDFGTSPLGFKVIQTLGGIELAPNITDNIRLRMTAQRRSVTESFLSYSGATDPYSGKTWGGVVRSEGKVAVESSIGPWNLYVGGNAGQLTGRHVKSNEAYDVGAGATYPVFTGDQEELRLGVDLHYSHFDKNLRFFTYGQGGYFSPQRFLTAMVPITYHNSIDQDVSYDLNGSVGYQQFADSRSPYFPIDPGLQSQITKQALTNPLLSTYYAGTHSSGISGGVSGQINVRLTDSLTVGAKGSFLQSGDYQQYGGGFFARYVFNGFEVR